MSGTEKKRNTKFCCKDSMERAQNCSFCTLAPFSVPSISSASPVLPSAAVPSPTGSEQHPWLSAAAGGAADGKQQGLGLCNTRTSPSSQAPDPAVIVCLWSCLSPVPNKTSGSFSWGSLQDLAYLICDKYHSCLPNPAGSLFWKEKASCICWAASFPDECR